ncbi:GAF domain-containing SpoIIE family protein phosphatase [Hugenholtzia roseola]|uniref:GAF domain-containing SpoIIE family protein phosphatase n=1 Tax=Hugenholtzia roseola TaxID=1002 RepID=UPI0003F92279|nr:SpoIIE family protein phosphatase [Hugenholtzia roseola]
MTRQDFQNFLKDLSEANWEQTQADLADFYRLLSENYQQEPNIFAEHIITWLSQKVGAMMGVFWAFREDTESLHFSAGFACDAAMLTKTKVGRESEGVYRAVIKNKEVFFFENLNHFFYQSATYQIPLRSWLILPIMLNENLLAVVELYHPNHFHTQKLHLLWQALGQIAAAWSGVSEQDKRKALIEKLHHQNEEIRAQEEELRQQTEELIAINENLEQVKRQLEEKNHDILRTKTLIEKKNENIMASIQYAQRIQQAMLPSAEILKERLGEYALLFMPRDVVSGDFYWTFQNAQGTWVAAVDCTGHGVPAALMAMMGMNLLEHAMSHYEKPSPAQVLTYLNERVQSLLRVGETNTKDGMDMSLCLLDYKGKKIHYAGAMNAAYYLTEKGIERLEHTRLPIGKQAPLRRKESFVNQQAQMQGNGMLYLCSDGFQDQFGGANNKKFMRGAFLNLLQEIWRMPAIEQARILRQNFELWKGEQDQTDDVLVLGVRV